MKKKIFMILFLLTVFFVGTVNADEINKFYSDSDQNIKFEETVNGDTALAGTLVDIIGNIDGIGFIAGETVNVNGNLEYGFIAGNNINIKSNIEKNLYLAGSNIVFDKGATIGRDILMLGDTVSLNGKLERNIDASATNITIKKGTMIYGNITLDANKITIEDDVTIHGSLKYNEDATISISDKALITYSEKVKVDNQDEGFDTAVLLSSIINLVIVFLVVVILAPKAMEKTTSLYEKKGARLYIKNCAIGLLILFLIPILCLFLLISNIGIALGLLLAALYAVAIYLSYVFAGFLLGELLLIKGLKLSTNKYLSGIIGIILLKVLTLIPVAGGIITFLAVTIGIATIWFLVQNDKDKKPEIKEAKVEVKKAPVAKAKTTTKKTTKAKPKTDK